MSQMRGMKTAGEGYMQIKSLCLHTHTYNVDVALRQSLQWCSYFAWQLFICSEGHLERVEYMNFYL